MACYSGWVNPRNGEVVAVFRVFNGSYVAGYVRKSGSVARFKSPKLPPTRTRYTAEKALFAYATAEGWEWSEKS